MHSADPWTPPKTPRPRHPSDAYRRDRSPVDQATRLAKAKAKRARRRLVRLAGAK